MKTNHLIIRAALIVLSFCIYNAKGATVAVPDDYADVQSCNKEISNSLSHGDIKGLLQHYSGNCVYLPEFSAVVRGHAEVEKFYRVWISTSRILQSVKSIYEVQRIGSHILETGNFSMNFIKTADTLHYTGKYMVIWQRDSKGKLAIIAEAFGADHYIEPVSLPYPAGNTAVTTSQEVYGVNKKLRPQLISYDKALITSVLDGDGESRARGFTDDGIYMPHFDPMQIGMANLRPYMLKTYIPNTISFVRNTYNEIFDTGEFVLLSGHFNVELNNAEKTAFNGDMLNLMKRDNNGRLLMYRQIAHN